MRTTLGAVLSAMLVAAGCSGGGAAPPPTALPTSSESHSATPGPSASPVRTGPLTTGPGVLPGEKPPVERDLAHEHSQAGGYAFATYFMQALSWSIATNDGWLIRQLSSPLCQTCIRYLNTIDSLHARHETQRGGRPAIRSSRRLLGSLPYGAEVGVDYVIDDTGGVLLPSNTTIHPNPGLHTVIYLVWSGQGWAVREEAQ